MNKNEMIINENKKKDKSEMIMYVLLNIIYINVFKCVYKF